MKKIIFLLLTVVTLLVGCTTQTGSHETIERAKQLMNEYPDSALALLDSLQPYQGAFSKSMRMDFMMQRLNAQNKCDTIFRSDSIAKILVDYYAHHGTSNQRMLANYLAGRVYYDMGELPYALQFYQDAAEAADTTRADCDLYTLYAVYGQMAQLFHAQFLPEDEMIALRAAEQCAWKDNDTLSALMAYELRIRPYYLKNEKDSVLFILNHVRDLYLQYGYRENVARVLPSIISICIDRKQYAESSKLMNVFEKESAWFDENGQYLHQGSYFYDKGRYLLAMGKVDSAAYLFTKLLDTGYKEDGYNGLLQVYEKRGTPDSIAKYAKLYANANDSSFLQVNQSVIHQISAMYDYSRHQKMAEKEKVEAEKAKRGKFALWTALIGLAAIAAALSFESFRRRKDAERRYQRLLLRYERMEADVNSRQQEDAEDIKETAIYRRLMDLLAEEPGKNIALGKDDWQELETEVDKFHPQFRKTLESYYHLSDIEYHISLLTKLNIEPSKICRLVNRSKQTVSTTRTRLFTKVFGRKGNPADWDQFIDSL